MNDQQRQLEIVARRLGYQPADRGVWVLSDPQRGERVEVWDGELRERLRDELLRLLRIVEDTEADR